MDVLENAHAANYQRTERELLTALTAAQLAERLNKIVAAGHGHKPVGLMFIEQGMTGVVPIRDCFVPKDYDGDHIALTEKVWYKPHEPEQFVPAPKPTAGQL